MRMSGKQRLYGQLLVDFANSDSTDEAGLLYFENVKKVFGFTDQFVVQAKNKFPTLETFNALLKSKSEKRCFDLIIKKADIESLLSSPISGDSLEYDVYSKSFHFLQLEAQSLEDVAFIEDYKYTKRTWSVKKLREIILSNHADPSLKLSEEKVDNLITELKNLAEQIIALKDISSKRYKEISELLPDYREMMFEHEIIEKWQADLNSLLDQIAQPNLIQADPILDKITNIYNKIPRSEVYLSPEGPMKEDAPFKEGLFLNRENSFDTLLIYDGLISYCVINFLIDSICIKYLKKCRYCHDFFIAEDPRREFCNEPKECKYKHNKEHIKQHMRMVRSKSYR